MTFILGGLRATISFDVKRVVAMSTLSHLGLMCYVLFSGAPSVCFAHLIRHALFKSNVFLSAGRVILSSKHSQDIRLMSPAGTFAPWSTLSLLLGLWSLGGLPGALSYLRKGRAISSTVSRRRGLLFMGSGVVLRFLYSGRLAMYLVLSPYAANVTPPQKEREPLTHRGRANANLFFSPCTKHTSLHGKS